MQKSKDLNNLALHEKVLIFHNRNVRSERTLGTNGLYEKHEISFPPFFRGFPPKCDSIITLDGKK